MRSGLHGFRRLSRSRRHRICEILNRKERGVESDRPANPAGADINKWPIINYHGVVIVLRHTEGDREGCLCVCGFMGDLYHRAGLRTVIDWRCSRSTLLKFSNQVNDDDTYKYVAMNGIRTYKTHVHTSVCGLNEGNLIFEWELEVRAYCLFIA